MKSSEQTSAAPKDESGISQAESRQERNERRRRERAEREAEAAKLAVTRETVFARLESRDPEYDLDEEEDDELEDFDARVAGAAPVAAVAPPVNSARLHMRHIMVFASFVCVVLLPTLLVALYMYFRAADQYVSEVAFSVRSEEAGSALDILGGLTQISSSSSSDVDVLFKYLQSQNVVTEIDADLDLFSIWGKAERDPYFGLQERGAIEDLTAYWNRMVNIYYDGSAQILEIHVNAFAPEDARLVAEAVLARSSALVNELSGIAREDATRYAREDLEAAIERLKSSRVAISKFRSENLLLDPSQDAQGQVGLINGLQAQLVESLIEGDLLLETTTEGDPRLDNVRRRIDVIRNRIAEERKNFGNSAGQEEVAYAAVLAEFESLTVDKEFAEQAYVAALAGYDAALAEAGRQTRYVAAHIRPTTPEKSTAPVRLRVISIFALFAFLSWSVFVLVGYALRDRS